MYLVLCLVFSIAFYPAANPKCNAVSLFKCLLRMIHDSCLSAEVMLTEHCASKSQGLKWF